MALNVNASEIKAEEFIASAEKALKRFSIFSTSAKFEDACEAYEKAGNQYKIAKKWQEAGECYTKCAEMQIKLSDTSRSAQFYQTSAEAFRKVNSAEAIASFQKAASMMCDSGRFTNAAKIQKEIAGIFEADEKYEEAVDNYRMAADYYSGENQASSANAMLLKVAEYSAQLQRYSAAMEIYETVAASTMESNLLKYSAKGHLLNAGICCLALKDQVLTTQKREEYDEIDFTFADSREGKLFNALAQAVEDFDADAFADAVYQYDSISKLDTWKVTMLLRVKESITEGADEAMSLT